MGRGSLSFAPCFSTRILLVCVVLAAGCASTIRRPFEKQPLVLQGVVFESRRGQVAPLGNSTVVGLWAADADPEDATARPVAEARTDEQGRFRLPVPKGWGGREALVSFRSQGYRPHNERYALPVEATGETLVVVIRPGIQGWTPPSWGTGPASRNPPEPSLPPWVLALPTKHKPSLEPTETAKVLATPIFTARSNGLHYLVLVPPFEGPDVLSDRKQSWDALVDFASGKLERSQGGTATFIDGTYSEFDLRWRLGLWNRLEARAWVSMGGRDGDLRISTLNRPRLPEGASNLALGDLVLGAKYALYRPANGRSAASLAMHVKVPTGSREEVLSTGGVDLAATAAGSRRLGRLMLQAEASAVLLGKERLLQQPLALDNVYAAAAGVSLPFKRWSLLAQVESNTSAFGDLGALRDTPTSAHLGARWVSGDRYITAGLGWGLTEAASSMVGSFGITLRY